jgi:glyoxylase-like metal-dependent hydrolase (beta-lactamase superfamily II)
MDELLPGIFHWQTRHPNIGAEVSSYLLADSGTLLDPLLPEGEGPDWVGRPVERVVLTVRHHTRSAAEFGVPVFVHASGRDDLARLDAEVRTYEAGDELAPGVRVLPFGRICPDDAALRIDVAPGVLAFGDGLMHYRGLGIPPDSLLGDDPEAVKADIREGLRPLAEEDFDAMLFAHGTPVVEGGKAMLRQFLAQRA